MRRNAPLLHAGLLSALLLAGCPRQSVTATSETPSPSASTAITSAPPTAAALASAAPRTTAPATSASAMASGASAPSPAPTWPVPAECEAVDCTVAPGEPGLRCGANGTCGNPCLKGMAPEKGRMTCSKLCRKAADCGGDPCTPEGVCDHWPKQELACDSPEMCQLPPGQGTGMRCGKGPCIRSCKKGLVLTGGTHCAKPCKKGSDCPGGECSFGVCGPLCPAEGCPYLWE